VTTHWSAGAISVGDGGVVGQEAKPTRRRVSLLCAGCDAALTSERIDSSGRMTWASAYNDVH